MLEKKAIFIDFHQLGCMGNTVRAKDVHGLPKVEFICAKWYA